MRLADYVFQFVSKLDVQYIFSIPGAGSMYLNDALGRAGNVKPISPHHEQALAMNVEAYARVKGFGAGLVTTGPGGTNAITGVVGAWIDCTPCLFISGQINVRDTIANTGLRQRGIQEVDIVTLVKPITKYAVLVEDPLRIRYHLEKAVYLAKSGKPGPVWVDIPLDFQRQMIEPDKLESFKPETKDKPKTESSNELKKKVAETVELLMESERPIFWVGNGLKLSHGIEEFHQLLKTLKIPVATTWNGADIIEDAHPLFVGRPGLFGQRGANFSIQNSDLFISIGNRLSIPQTGYNFKAFLRDAKKVFVDVDRAEIHDKPFKADIGIAADAKEFILELESQLKGKKLHDFGNWVKTCRDWKEKYLMVTSKQMEKKDYVSSYVFIDRLSDELQEKDVIGSGLAIARKVGGAGVNLRSAYATCTGGNYLTVLISDDADKLAAALK